MDQIVVFENLKQTFEEAVEYAVENGMSEGGIEEPCEDRGYWVKDGSYNVLETSVITDDTNAKYEVQS